MDNLTKLFSFELPTKIIYGANCLDNLCVELKENKEDFAFVREIVCYVVVNLRERRLKGKSS